MRLYRTTVVALTIVGSAAVTVAKPGTRPAISLTGPQIMQRCRRAYDGLTSYQGLTKVVTTASFRGHPQTFTTTAFIKFTRPNLIRVDGTMMMDGTFAFVSNGHTTWRSMSTAGHPGRWEKTRSVEMAVASVTGIGLGAGTTIPAILLHTRWGTPVGFTPAAQITSRPVVDRVNGRAAYRVTATMPQRTETYWVDQRSFLLLRLKSHQSLPHLGRGATPKAGGGMDSDDTFSNVQVNRKVDPKVFAKPNGAPS